MNGFGAIGELSIAEVVTPTITPSPGGLGAVVWGYELLPGVTAGDMLIALFQSSGTQRCLTLAQFLALK